jgi:hypothetical protein
MRCQIMTRAVHCCGAVHAAMEVCKSLQLPVAFKSLLMNHTCGYCTEVLHALPGTAPAAVHAGMTLQRPKHTHLYAHPHSSKLAMGCSCLESEAMPYG